MAINAAKLRGAYKDYELNFNYYSSRISIDFSYYTFNERFLAAKGQMSEKSCNFARV